MINPQVYDYIIYGCAGVFAAAVAYVVAIDIKQWLDQKKQYAEACRLATQNHINGLMEQISRLQDDIRAYAARELSYLNERKITSARLSFMAREIACDPDKKTQVLTR